MFSLISCHFHFPFFSLQIFWHTRLLSCSTDLWWGQSSAALYFSALGAARWRHTVRLNSIQPEILSESEFPLPFSGAGYKLQSTYWGKGGWEAKSSINGVPPCPPQVASLPTLPLPNQTLNRNLEYSKTKISSSSDFIQTIHYRIDRLKYAFS